MIKHNEKQLVLTALILMLLLMTLLRIDYFLQVRHYPGYNHFLTPDDQLYYHQTARRIADGHVLAEDGAITRGPGYLYFLGTIYSIFGSKPTAALIIQWGLGILTGLLIFLLSRRLFGERIALAAVLLYALYLPALCYEGALLMASPVTFLLTAGLYFLIRAVQDDAASSLMLSGTCYGLAFLCRPNNLIFFLFGLFFLIFNKYGRRSLLPFSIPFVLLYGLLMIRNYAAGADLLSVTAQGPRVLMNSHFHEAIGIGWWWQDNWDLILTRYENNLRGFLTFLAGDIAGHPVTWIKLQLSKFYAFFFNYEFSQFIDFYAQREVLSLLRLPYIPIGVLSTLAIPGLVFLFRERRENNKQFLLALYFIAGVFSVTFFYVLGRFRLPLIPLFCIIGAVGLLRLPGAFSSATWKGRICLAAALVALFLAFNTGPMRKIYAERFMPTAIYNRGVHYRVEGRLNQAISDFKQIYDRLAPDTDADVYYTVSMNLAAGLLQTGKGEQAAVIWKDLIQKLPDRARPYFLLGRYYTESGRYERARTYIQQAIALKPEENAYHRLLETIRDKTSAGEHSRRPPIPGTSIFLNDAAQENPVK